MRNEIIKLLEINLIKKDEKESQLNVFQRGETWQNKNCQEIFARPSHLSGLIKIEDAVGNQVKSLKVG